MLYIIIVSLAVLFTLSMSALLWRSREQALMKLIDAQKETFKGAASTAFESSLGQFMTYSDQRHRAMDDLIKPMTEMLEKYQEQIRRVEVDRQKSSTAIDLELKKIADAHLSLAKETGALKDALKKPHVRGRWGEVQLRNCIELAGMSE